MKFNENNFIRLFIINRKKTKTTATPRLKLSRYNGQHHEEAYVCTHRVRIAKCRGNKCRRRQRCGSTGIPPATGADQAWWSAWTTLNRIQVEQEQR